VWGDVKTILPNFPNISPNIPYAKCMGPLQHLSSNAVAAILNIPIRPGRKCRRFPANGRARIVAMATKHQLLVFLQQLYGNRVTLIVREIRFGSANIIHEFEPSFAANGQQLLVNFRLNLLA
jgi:hypothetical protein